MWEKESGHRVLNGKDAKYINIATTTVVRESARGAQGTLALMQQVLHVTDGTEPVDTKCDAHKPVDSDNAADDVNAPRVPLPRERRVYRPPRQCILSSCDVARIRISVRRVGFFSSFGPSQK